jgi:hypothetical protein
MKRNLGIVFYVVWIVVCLVLAFSMAKATTLTGTLNLPNGTGANGNLIFSLAQQGALVSAGSCGGPATIVPTAQIIFPIANGAFSGTPTLYGNDCMNPQGTYYNVIFQDNNGNTLFTDRWQISGSSINIGTIISITVQGTTQTLGSTGVLLFDPTGNQIINQPAGTATSANFLTVTGTLTFPSGASCNAAGCTGLDTGTVTLATAQTVSGQKTFSSDVLLTGGASIGSTTYPAAYGFFSNTLEAPQVRIILGSVASPTDYFYWAMSLTHDLTLTDSSDITMLTLYDSTASTVPGNIEWSFKGAVGAIGGFIQGPQIGSDLVCAGVVNGYTVLRTDVVPPQLQICVSSTLYKLPI